jgi:Clp amino terminal domain, pathogenicity island component
MYPFERFTEEAKKVLTLAQEEAERSQHSYIGTEHLLLALLATESEARRILGVLGVEAPDVRQVLKAVLGRSERLNIQRIIPTSRVKKVIQIAFEAADREGSTAISPTHLLLGLLQEGEGIAAHVLQDRHVTIEKVMALRGPASPDPEPWPVPGSRVLVHDPDPPYRLWEGIVMGHDTGQVVVQVPLHPIRPEAHLPASALHPVPLRFGGDCQRCLAPGGPPAP